MYVVGDALVEDDGLVVGIAMRAAGHRVPELPGGGVGEEQVGLEGGPCRLLIAHLATNTGGCFIRSAY